MDAKTVFNTKLPQLLSSSPDLAKEMDAVYVFHISGNGGGTWTVDMKSNPPSCTSGDKGNADCTIEISDEDFVSLVADPNSGMNLYFQGKIKIEGNPMLATKLQQLLSFN